MPPPYQGRVWQRRSPTSAIITDESVFGFTGTARPVWLDVICLANQLGILNALKHLGTGQCSDSAPSRSILLPTVVTTLLTGLTSHLSSSARASACAICHGHRFNGVANASVPVNLLLLGRSSPTATYLGISSFAPVQSQV
jgi:hypothetical protein